MVSLTSDAIQQAVHELLIAVELGGSIPYFVGNSSWIDLTPRQHSATMRVKVPDLRTAQRTTAAIRAAASGDTAVAVTVDLDTLLAVDARAACAQLEDLVATGYIARRSDSLRYAGTPAGLAGLIIDIVATGAAEGVTLRPLTTPTLRRFLDETLPKLQEFGLTVDQDQVARLTAPHARIA
jgi:hypothetical protein